MKTYNVIFELYGGIRAVNGIVAENENDAVNIAKRRCGFYPVHLKECVETDQTYLSRLS